MKKKNQSWKVKLNLYEHSTEMLSPNYFQHSIDESIAIKQYCKRLSTSVSKAMYVFAKMGAKRYMRQCLSSISMKSIY